MKLLAIDVGNSNVMLAIFNDAELLTSWRLNSNPGKTQDDWWITIEREITELEERTIWSREHSINGKKYDLIGLLSHATPWKIIVPHRDRYWCSEADACVTKPAIYTGESTEITPDELFAWLMAHPQTKGQ